MFDAWSQWTWVAVAWSQVVIDYGLYLAYLGRRRRLLLEDDSAQRLLQEETARVDGGGT